MKIWLLLALCLPLTACSIRADTDEKTGDIKNVHISIGSLEGIKGSGKHGSVTRTITAIKSIDAMGSVDIVVKVGAAPSLTVEGDENLLAKVVTEQDGDRLIVRTKDSFSTNQPLVVTVVTPSLSGIKSLGSGDIKVSGLVGDDLTVESTGSGDLTLSGKTGVLTARVVGSGNLTAESLVAKSVKVDVLGSGDVDLGTIDVTTVEASVKGSGSVKASGKAGDIKGNVLGSGSIDFETLKAQTGEYELLGSGDITAYASQSVKAKATGTGDLVIHGKPTNKQLSGENASTSDD